MRLGLELGSLLAHARVWFDSHRQCPKSNAQTHLNGVIQRPNSGPHSSSVGAVSAPPPLLRPCASAGGPPRPPASQGVVWHGSQTGGATAPGGRQQANSWTTWSHAGQSARREVHVRARRAVWWRHAYTQASQSLPSAAVSGVPWESPASRRP